MSEVPTSVQAEPITRRGFLKGLVGVSASIAIGPALLQADASASPQHPVESSDTDRLNSGNLDHLTDTTDSGSSSFIASDKESDKVDTYSDTAEKAALLLSSNVLLGHIAKTAGITTGNVSLQRQAANQLGHEERMQQFARLARRDILDAIFAIGVKGPIIEEGIFRLIPSKVSNVLGVKGNAWPVGILTSAAYARIHARNPEGTIRSIPFQQFNLGLLTWWLQRNRGFTHALFAHSVNNTPPALGMGIGYEINRRNHSY